MERIIKKKVVLDCPICNERHEFEERTGRDTILIKGELVEYDEVFFACDKVEEHNTFVVGKMMSANLLNAKNAYRKKKGLLTSTEIVGIREQYGLSQVDLANLLGWGEATISRYESKAIQDEPYDNILRSIRENPMVAHEYLEKNKEKLGNKYSEIKMRVIKNMEQHGMRFLERQALEGEYVPYEEQSEFNGNKKLDIIKLENIINYFASQLKNLYKVKLMKLLWYADALSYKLNGISLTGLVYYHYDMGALPIGHYKILELDNINVKEEFEGLENVKYHILPSDHLDMSAFTSQELDILNRVIQKFKYFNAQEIAKYMHEEAAYRQTKPEELISFELAKEIRPF